MVSTVEDDCRWKELVGKWRLLVKPMIGGGRRLEIFDWGKCNNWSVAGDDSTRALEWASGWWRMTEKWSVLVRLCVCVGGQSWGCVMILWSVLVGWRVLIE